MQQAPASSQPVSIDLIDELPAAVLVLDAAGGIQQVNRAAARVLGCSRESLIGRNVAAMAHPDDEDRSATRAALGPGGKLARRCRLLHADRSYRHFDEEMRALPDGRTVSVLHDITTSAAETERLRENEEQLLFVANALPALIAYVGTDARYVWGSDAYRRWFGYSQERLRGVHMSEVKGPAAWAEIRHHVDRVLAGEEVSFESRLTHSDGRERDIRAAYVPHRDANGQVLGFVGLVTDVTEMSDAERALQHSERMLAESQAAAHVGSWEATLGGGDDGALDSLRWSDEAYRMFGHDPARTQASTELFQSAIHPDDREALRATTAAGMKKSGRFEKEYRIVRPDGTVRMIHAWTTVERDAAGRMTRLLGTCEDVTEDKLAEQAIRAAREQLQLVVDSTPAFILRCDREGRLVWTNKANAARFGATPEELAGKWLFDVIGSEAFAVIAASADRVLGGETLEMEAEIPYRTLGPRSMHIVVAPTLDARGIPDGCVGVLTDNTQRRALERALRLSEERYRSLVGAITSVVWTASAAGEYVEPQPAWEAYTGQTWSQHQGRGWLLAYHPDDRMVIEKAAREAGRTGTFDSLAFRIWNAASADYRFCETSAIAMRDPDDSIREWIGTVVDVHERERALRDLKEADRRKDEFLAMLSHELRNPLAPILSSVEILRLVGQSKPEVSATYRGVIAQQVQHMKRLLDDLLDVSRASQGKIELRKEVLDLGPILLQAVEVSRPLIVEKAQTLSISLAPGPAVVDADPTRLVQVFGNLLNNASKYSDRGGHIALEMSVADGDVRVRVRDNGVGMSAELLESAFDLFVQETRSLDRAQGGLGIGLTMVRSLVKMHGGSVRATSDGPGRGSELFVTLPRSRTIGPPAVARSAPVGTDGASRPLRVLVVDDNVAAARSLGELLALLGHQVTLAHDGPAALAMSAATEATATPELVLIDIGLPGMDGYAVAAALRSSGLERAALVALTGYGREEDTRRSRETGFDQHLVKPIDLAALQRLMAGLENRARR